MSFLDDSDDDISISSAAEPNSTKNLSSLFSADQGLNSSFKASPQQAAPQKPTTPQQSPGQTSVYHYATVQLYK